MQDNLTLSCSDQPNNQFVNSREQKSAFTFVIKHLSTKNIKHFIILVAQMLEFATFIDLTLE